MHARPRLRQCHGMRSCRVWLARCRGQGKRAFRDSYAAPIYASPIYATHSEHLHRANLSQEQLAAVTAPLLPTRVIAGPGSGKTRVLASRIVELVRVHDVKPWNILAITFTNKAAHEIQERVQLALGPDTGKSVFTGTFHSFCYRILRQYLDTNTSLSTIGPRRPGWSLYDQDASLTVILDLVKSSYEGMKASEAREKAKAIQSKVSAVKMNQDVSKDVAPWLVAYEDAMQKANALDFDDLLLFTVRLLQQNTLSLRERLHLRWKHILVDEFQDTNAVQYDLVTLLAYPPPTCGRQVPPDIRCNHVFVVGDQDQAIYGWRGALVDNMRKRFAIDFPNGLVFRLRDNYRSTPSIIRAAQQVIKSVNDPERVELRPAKNNANGPIPMVASFFDSFEEAEHIGDEIQRLVTLVEPSQIAVLFRTHQQSRLIEQALVRRGIHYVLVGSQPFWKRVEIQDIMAYLRLALSLNDDVALLRIINVPKRGLGDASVSKLAHAASLHHEGSLSRLLFERGEAEKSRFSEISSEIGLTPKAIAAVSAFREVVLECRRVLLDTAAGYPLPTAIGHLIDDIIKYRDHVRNGGCGGKAQGKEDEVQSRLDRLDQLVACAAEFVNRTVNSNTVDLLLEPDSDDTGDGKVDDDENHMKQLLSMVPMARSFVDECALLSPSPTLKDVLGQEVGMEKTVEQGVKLMTMHASKGLEFDTVFIPGCIEGLVPLVQGLAQSGEGEEDALEEETRLFFVSITRAKRELRLLYTCTYMTRGRSVPASPSRFVIDLLKGQHAALLPHSLETRRIPLPQDKYEKSVQNLKETPKAKALQRRRALR
jgi:DNA helicase-2/ATP-dependent DNA helicase PcrA